MNENFFLFSNWNPQLIFIASRLLPHLCRHGAGLYGVDFPRNSTIQEVRVGWENPNSDRKHILSIFEPRGDALLWELRVRPDSRFITANGPLQRLKMERSKEDQESQLSKGCIMLTSPDLPEGFEDWIDEAFEYTRMRYGLV
ncbi:hypothetical protein KIH39_26340 [Telmatocola sphagniphila]|uniref:Uncharacterized protein n=1 Tax=Telmatocola sphagniphila TaxID=1123043 RepID=A0A8E6B6E0_9BACT|nr:hypothetical protein [Telmatocola sphagniphila]QVL32309.1 hypothetical protein KIH39_26340 [Telmatocola sphagniphila]